VQGAEVARWALTSFATQRTWIVKTAAPHEYTWRLPKKGWGMLGRIVGYRREGKYFRTDH
jgi:hypothetical protein